MEEKTKSPSGLNIITVIFLIFLTLKLSGFGVVANWSWFWVFSPLWISWGIVCLVFLISELNKKD